MSKNKRSKHKATEKTKPISNFWSNNKIAAIILFLIAFGLYAYSISFEYVLDDQIVITENSFTKKGFAGIGDILTKESFVGRFGEQKNLVLGARYRPLSIVTFAVEYQFFGLNPSVSHAINIILYALLGLLIFRVLHFFIPKKAAEPWFFSFAFLAALLFIVHPVHTEVVANIKGRDEIMVMMGAFAALYFSFKYVESQRFLYLFLSGIAFFLACLSKENALTFLFVIPLSLYFFQKPTKKDLALTLMPLLLSAILYLVIRYQVIGYFLSSDGGEITDIMNNPFYGLSHNEKFATIFYTLGLYIKLLFFPHPLTHDYYPYQIPVVNAMDIRAILPFLVHIVLGVLALIGIKKKSIWAYGILFYVATLSIVSNLPFTVGTFMNERFIFLPSFGFCLILIWFLKEKFPLFIKNKKNQQVNLLLLGVIVIAFSIKTLMRVPDWKNRMALNLSGVIASPNSARANCFLGTAIFEEEYRKTNDVAQKKTLIKDVAYFIDRALAIHPNYGSALIMHSGVVAEEYGYDGDLKKLLDEFYSILTRKSNIPFIGTYLAYLSKNHSNNQLLIDFAYKTGYQFFGQNRKDYNNAIKYLNYGLQAAPNNRTLLQSMGNIYQTIGNQQEANKYLSRIRNN
jgi:hypothetical protein